jgi:uncharacterized membrane protein YkvA (DUF1232 family)
MDTKPQADIPAMARFLIDMVFANNNLTKEELMNTNFNASQLWDTIKDYAKKVGRVGARPVLLLYFVMTDENTSRSVKLTIGSALAYVVLPVNLISLKKHPLTGWVDEAAAIAMVVDKVKKQITPEIERKADEVLDKWFPGDTPFEVVK